MRLTYGTTDKLFVWFFIIVLIFFGTILLLYIDVQRIVNVFPEIVNNLRRISPYWDSRKDRPRPDADDLMERAT